MRNLKTISYQDTAVKGDLPLTATAWDASNDSVICAFGPTPDKPIIEIKRKLRLEAPETEDENTTFSKFVAITSWDSPCPLPDLTCDEILLMHYFPDNLTACLVLAGGDLILVREEPEDGQERIEIVGSIDVGIIAAAWAPDEELLAIVTRSDSLVLMSRDLEPVTETTMSAEDLQTSKHVSVGWGKKETQFQGKRAKAMRDPTMPEHVDEGAPSPYEDGKVTVSWRGDGAYLAINASVPNHRRAIRVYTREGSLDSASEPVDGLESALSWRPAGNLIAGIKRSGSGENCKLEIIFFERNGLRHGGFLLRLKSAEFETMGRHMSLAWNPDSSVLAVSMMGVVQFWTMGNYHYYLKQQVQVDYGSTNSPLQVVWHPEKTLKCAISSMGSLVDLEYMFHVHRGSTIKPNDYGIAAVIDGNVLKLTPLRHAGVPPPMSYCDMETNANIIDIAMSQDGQWLAALTSTGIELCQWQMRQSGRNNEPGDLRHTTNMRKHELTWSGIGISEPSTICCTQIAFQGNIDIFVLSPPQTGLTARCFQLKLKAIDGYDSDLGDILQSVRKLDIANGSQTLLVDNDQETTWVQNAHSTQLIGRLDSHDEHSTTSLKGGHPSSIVYQAHPELSHEITNGYDQSFYKVSLTTKGHLLVDHRVLAKDCTSFILTDLHLIYTTTQHLLKFVHLTNPENMEVPGDTPEVDERCRSVERGAKIVTVMPSTYAVVLQMPRGNLETIYPRVLVLSGIRDSLRNLDYRMAFLACQNHQVDMNIIHDYLPGLFMDNVKKFIEDLKKPSRVDEFLSKLKEDNVAETLYKDTLRTATGEAMPKMNDIGPPTSNSPNTGTTKVNTICDAIITILKNKPGKFLQCIITAHVCKRPPDLQAALMLVSSLRQTSPDEADLAVSHLCFLTDTNRLYDAALALYDLELTLLVAQNAQRDPREYMPFLQNLQSLPPLRRQYQIDNHLRNYEKALTSLHALESHEEVEAYTVKHLLYTKAMDLYKYSATHLSRLTTLYAEYLSSQSQHSAAAILYESLNLYVEAYPLYALAHHWRESLTCASLIPLDASQLRSLAQSLATTCADESRDYRSAATIHTEYLSDPVTASKLLCKSSYFAEATRLLSHHNLAIQIPTTIDPALGDKVSEILDLVADCKSQLGAQVPRIHDLRVKKAEDPLAFYGGDPSALIEGDNIPDNISLAPTDATTAGGQSLFTRYGGGSQGTRFGGTVASNVSRKTSRTKRREERKRARGKKGSVYEEEYLVASVGRLIERVNGVHDEVGRLVSGLLRRGMRERAKIVGERMSDLQLGCERARREVWGDLIPKQDNVEVDGEEGRPSGADGVYWDSQQQQDAGSGKGKEVPSVKAWKGEVLTLL